jgi:hypothetical protein
MRAIRRTTQRLGLLATILLGWSCDSSPSDQTVQPVGFARAYDVWQPVAGDTCTPEVHNKFSVVGPDGKLYPTWHPPVDPATGCTFGHEHGRDPRGSDLFGAMGPLAFGYANEQLDAYAPHGMRHEDHVGHKVEWENDVRMDVAGGAGAILDITCDVLVKLHQGTHSKDAFTNNLHELYYAIRCSDRTELRIIALTAIGTPGEFKTSCDRREIFVGPATPPTSPNGNGIRIIPDRECVERFMLVPAGQRSNFHSALHENWEMHTTIKRQDGRQIASVDAYFQVFFPSRFYDPASPTLVGRPIDVCSEVTPDGRRANGKECSASMGDGAFANVGYDDPRSVFNGVKRVVDINGNRVTNDDGPEIWYTDPFGKNAQRDPFPGSIRQFIAKADNSGRVAQGPQIGRHRDYGGPGVHAPN